ncbi:MAG: MoxR family ATPase [Bradymonadales bacterium]|jgi:MoxR-like ATPase
MLDAAQVKETLLSQMKTLVVGKEDVIELLLVALLCGGHILLEGAPGLAKTTIARAFAQCLGIKFGRVQFTMDLLPSDITGTSIFRRQSEDFVFMPGPLFSNILLADEINRAPAKTQSALLEAMQERQVTVDGKSLALQAPFLVLATQNPLEEHGVYALPDGELDRFLFRVILDYPSQSEEITMLKQDRLEPPTLEQILDKDEIAALSTEAQNVQVHEEIYRYIAKLSQFSRSLPQILRGVSPRGSIGLLRAARVKALLDNRNFVLPDDVRWALPYVFNHRLHFDVDFDDVERQKRAVTQILENVRFS